MFALPVDRLLRLGVALQVLFWSLDALLDFPASLLQTSNAATLRVRLCMLPGFQYHPVKSR